MSRTLEQRAIESSVQLYEVRLQLQKTLWGAERENERMRLQIKQAREDLKKWEEST